MSWAVSATRASLRRSSSSVSRLPGDGVTSARRVRIEGYWPATGSLVALLIDGYGGSMTERKPAGKSFTSWIDQQIQEAQERGAFDDLPGSGRPLPRRSAADDGQAWLRSKLQREGVSTEELLPVPLKLRKQAERLAESVQELRTEQDVRAAVAELNRRIIEWRRIPLGPQIFVPLVSPDQMVDQWRERRAAQAALARLPGDTGRTPGAKSPATRPARTRPGGRVRWWQRLRWPARARSRR